MQFSPSKCIHLESTASYSMKSLNLFAARSRQKPPDEKWAWNRIWVNYTISTLGELQGCLFCCRCFLIALLFLAFFFFYPTFPVTNLGCRIHIYRFFCISSQDCCAGRSLHLLGFERRNGRVRCMWESLCRAFSSQDLQHHREPPKNYESLPPRIHNSAHNSASLEGLPTRLALAIRRPSKYRS